MPIVHLEIEVSDLNYEAELNLSQSMPNLTLKKNETLVFKTTTKQTFLPHYKY